MRADMAAWLQSRSAPGPDGCRLWTGYLTDGYGRVRIGGGRFTGAHQVAWTLANGPVPDGLVLDHLCRRRHCIEPSHLEPVTNRENWARGMAPSVTNATRTACQSGHPFDDANTYHHGGRRQCRACNAAAVARYKARRRSAA